MHQYWYCVLGYVIETSFCVTIENMFFKFYLKWAVVVFWLYPTSANATKE